MKHMYRAFASGQMCRFVDLLDSILKCLVEHEEYVISQQKKTPLLSNCVSLVHDGNLHDVSGYTDHKRQMCTGSEWRV